MTYQRLDAPEFHATATTAWADQIGADFEALWTDRPTVSVTKTSATSCANNALVPLTWDHQNWQTGSWWSSGPTLYAPRSGFYFLSLSLDWDNSTSGNRRALIYVNGIPAAQESQEPDQTHGFATLTTSGAAYASAGDLFTGLAAQNSGSTLNALAGARLQAVWLGGYDL